MRELGLNGFVDKRETSVEVLRSAISAVLAGRSYYSECLGRGLAALRADPRAFNIVLTKHQQRILVLIGNAWSDEEIAAHLRIVTDSAQSRRRDIMRKLDIHSTPKLIQYAGTWVSHDSENMCRELGRRTPRGPSLRFLL